MWNFVPSQLPSPILYILYIPSRKKKSRYKSTFLPPEKPKVILPLRKMGTKVAKQTTSPFLFCGPFLWTLGSLFSGETPSFSRNMFGVWDPKPTPTNLLPTEKRKFRRPMLRSWNKWKPCIASYKPINPRWASGFTSLQYSLCWENVGFWGGFGETQRMSEWEDCIGLCVFFFFSWGSLRVV